MIEKYNAILSPILITGPARSGTSMIAGIFHRCGVWGGEMSGPTQFNRKGMFENASIRQLTKKILKDYNLDPLGQNPLPNDENLEHICSFYKSIWWKKILDIVRKQGYNKGDIWFYKGAKMVLLWPLWHDAFPDAKWIYVNRPKDDIVQSCLRTRFMRAYRKAEDWDAWVDHHLMRKEEMKQARIEVNDVYSNDIIKGDYTIIKQLIIDFGLKWNEKAVSDFVSPELWGGNIDD